MSVPETETTVSGTRPFVLLLTRWMAALSAALLIIIMVFTTLDVALRYLFNQPIRGGNEITEALMVALIMLAMPYCGAKKGHIRVDIFDNLFGKSGRKITDGLTNTISIVILWFLASRAWFKTVDTYRYQDVTNFIELPIWPLYMLIMIGVAGYALVLIIESFDILTGHHRD